MYSGSFNKCLSTLRACSSKQDKYPLREFRVYIWRGRWRGSRASRTSVDIRIGSANQPFSSKKNNYPGIPQVCTVVQSPFLLATHMSHRNCVQWFNPSLSAKCVQWFLARSGPTWKITVLSAAILHRTNRIPSELRSQTVQGPDSTGVGDRPGSPLGAAGFFILFLCVHSQQLTPPLLRTIVHQRRTTVCAAQVHVRKELGDSGRCPS